MWGPRNGARDVTGECGICRENEEKVVAEGESWELLRVLLNLSFFVFSSIKMSAKYDIVKEPPKALTFDVFGTVVSGSVFIEVVLLY